MDELNSQLSASQQKVEKLTEDNGNLIGELQHEMKV
jgi:hypothetical protein